jgi:hypothetical protein
MRKIAAAIQINRAKSVWCDPGAVLVVLHGHGHHQVISVSGFLSRSGPLHPAGLGGGHGPAIWPRPAVLIVDHFNRIKLMLGVLLVSPVCTPCCRWPSSTAPSRFDLLQSHLPAQRPSGVSSRPVLDLVSDIFDPAAGA